MFLAPEMTKQQTRFLIFYRLSGELNDIWIINFKLHFVIGCWGIYIGNGPGMNINPPHWWLIIIGPVAPFTNMV